MKTEKDKLIDRILENYVLGRIDKDEMMTMIDTVNRRKVVAIYCRVGSGGNADWRRTDLDAQKTFLKKFAHEQGYLISGYYEDDGFAGSDLRRPGLNKMVKDYSDGHYDSVLSVTYERLFRGEYLAHPLWNFEVQIPGVGTYMQGRPAPLVYMRVGNKNQLR